MRIVIIGTGNVARVLFERIGRTTHEVVQVVGRRPDVDGYFAATSYVDKLTLVDQSADLYLVAISDNALYELPGQLRLPGCTVAHTAGSVRADVLREVSGAFGVLYPLQTLRAGITGPEVVMPLLVDGADEVVIGRLETFSRDLSVLVRRAGDAERQRLHLAAVVVNNFTNHLYDTAPLQSGGRIAAHSRFCPGFFHGLVHRRPIPGIPVAAMGVQSGETCRRRSRSHVK